MAIKLVEEAKKATQALIRRDRESILRNIRSYEQFFDSNGHACPLMSQFERTLDHGIPTINRFVDTLLIGEMSTGILMGVQDWGEVAPPISFDLARRGESYDGMRGPISCGEGELVIRDDRGIIASYFQGPGARTAVTRQTKHVVFLGLGLPGMSADEVKGALEVCAGVLLPAAETVEYGGL